MERFFGVQSKDVAKQVKRLYRKHITAAKKAEETDDERLKRHAIEAAILLGNVKWGWESLAGEVQGYLQESYSEGAAIGEMQFPDIDAEEYMAELALRYAGFRSAELIGMKRNAAGELIPNPDAKWAISRTSRDDLQATVVQALEEGWTPRQLAAVIEASTMFSSGRAELIARTEMMAAQSLGTYTFWMATGKVISVAWETSGNETVCIVCEGYEAQGEVPLGHEFAPGVRHPLAHPRCDCRLKAVKVSEE